MQNSLLISFIPFYTFSQALTRVRYKNKLLSSYRVSLRGTNTNNHPSACIRGIDFEFGVESVETCGLKLVVRELAAF